MAVYSYDAKQVTVVAGGIILDGYSSGSFVTVERNDDMWKLTVGCDGVASRAKTNNKSARVTVTLQQSSKGNDALTALAQSDELANAGTFPILVRDGSGRTVISALTAWVVKYPSAEFGQEINDRAWIIETDNASIFLGGN